MEKLVSGFEAVSSSRVDEDAIFTKCRNAITFVEKVEKDVEGDSQLGTYIFILMRHCLSYLTKPRTSFSYNIHDTVNIYSLSSSFSCLACTLSILFELASSH